MCIKKINMNTITQAQFSQIVEIENDCDLEPYSKEILIDCIESLETFVCFDGEQVAGFITIQPQSVSLGGSIYIVNLNVAEQYRRKGIAAKLIRAACKHYDENKIMSLDVRKTNEADKNLYPKWGCT